MTKGWGHSDYEQIINFIYKLKNRPEIVVMTHHDPNHDDAFIDHMYVRSLDYAKTKDLNSRLIMACEGLELEL